MDNPWHGDAGIDLGAAHHVLALAASLGIVSEEVGRTVASLILGFRLKFPD